MRIDTSELWLPFDVDGTLIKNVPPSRSAMFVDYYGQMRAVLPMYNNISLLKAYKARGYEITVWSANGQPWALNVVKALNLESFVDEVCMKPQKFVDDLPAEAWMQRVFVPEDV